MSVEKPRLIKPARTLDFGAGFYTTTNRQQAADFSSKVVARARKMNLSTGGKPCISIYEFDEKKAFQTLNVLKFEAPDEKWLNFVFSNRKGEYSGQKYDLIIGAVANDDLYPTLLAYEHGILSAAQALEALKIKKLYDQYVFASDRALECLKFSGKFLPEV